MTGLGPFRVNPDGKTLLRNDYAWSNVANAMYLESLAGVGFSYSNISSDYDLTRDKRTAEDAYAFLVNWLERFPQYKTRDFYITEENYTGHYVPQLAYTILLNNNHTNWTIINLKGITVRDGFIDDEDNTKGTYDYLWTHALISDETNAGINKNCYGNITVNLCNKYMEEADTDREDINEYNIYAPFCSDTTRQTNDSNILNYDPCSGKYMFAYLNNAEVQKAMHANVAWLPYKWSVCSSVSWNDMPSTVLPIINKLVAKGLRIWLYSGDMDSVCPITGTKYSIQKLGYAVDTPWRAWYSRNEVGGYVVKYKGLVPVTVRGAGHFVPSYQPPRALTMISSFLQGGAFLSSKQGVFV